MSDPKWPIFVLYVLGVFPSSCPALDRVARNLAVNVLEFVLKLAYAELIGHNRPRVGPLP